jgi:ferredoxin
MSVKVRIDPIRCRGHAICALLTEGVELDDWGYGRVVDASPEGRDGLRRARRAAAACPNGAIVITGVDPVALGRRRGAGRRR